MENYNPKSTKKASQKKQVAKATAPKPVMKKESHTFLPDSFSFGQGVEECWATRENIMGNYIVTLHILATVAISELSKDWTDLIEMVRSKGYPVEVLTSGSEPINMRPHKGRQEELPFKLVYTDA